MGKVHVYFIVLCLSIFYIVPAGAEAREIWLNPVEAGKKGVGNWGGVKLKKEVHFHWRVPDDFDDNTGTAVLVLIGLKNQDLGYRVNASVTQNGQQHDIFQETGDTFEALVAGQLHEINLSEVLPTLTPGDYVALNFERVGKKKVKALIVGMRFQYIDTTETLLAGVTRSGNTLLFTGMNVQIVNGLGETDGVDDGNPFSNPGAVNGTGNLIIGYDEELGTDDKTGSHNLVIGLGHTYSSHGGLVAGVNSTVSGPWSSVIGGDGNTASGAVSSAIGGRFNTASGNYSSVSGGRENTASGLQSSVSGGRENTASGQDSSVSGGILNIASGGWSSVTGGGSNEASGAESSVTGGGFNEASGTESSVSGGVSNLASTLRASVSGGSNNTDSGQSSSVTGGFTNIASSVTSSVSGGQNNIASGSSSSVSGGLGNLASSFRSSVSGGADNTASGTDSSVSGGLNHESAGTLDWRAGTLFETQ